MNLTGQPIYQKGVKVASKRVRAAAKGQRCTLRLACCNHDPSTVVLAHLRMFGWAGAAEKPNDYLAVFACSTCHDALDGRGSTINQGLWGFHDVLRALGETLTIQFNAGTFTEGKP